jgi:hypothetical protein
MTRSTKVLFIAVPVVVVLGCVGAIVRVAPESGGPTRDEFVRESSSILQAVSSPQEAEGAIKRCGTVYFPNGEWVTGVGIDSHSWRRAKDTLVVRDSRGQVRAFVGHVCGPNWMPRYFPPNHPSFMTLEAFYAFLAEWGKPYTPPDA